MLLIPKTARSVHVHKMAPKFSIPCWFEDHISFIMLSDSQALDFFEFKLWPERGSNWRAQIDPNWSIIPITTPILQRQRGILIKEIVVVYTMGI